MSKKSRCFLVLFCLLLIAPVNHASAASNAWILYDDFKSGIIDPNKWYGYEPWDVAARRETARTILSKQLNLAERGYGNTTSNIGSALIGTGLRFTNPVSV
jgi:hypothetical protein